MFRIVFLFEVPAIFLFLSKNVLASHGSNALGKYKVSLGFTSMKKYFTEHKGSITYGLFRIRLMWLGTHTLFCFINC